MLMTAKKLTQLKKPLLAKNVDVTSVTSNISINSRGRAYARVDIRSSTTIDGVTTVNPVKTIRFQVPRSNIKRQPVVNKGQYIPTLAEIHAADDELRLKKWCQQFSKLVKG